MVREDQPGRQQLTAYLIPGELPLLDQRGLLLGLIDGDVLAS
jgi:hypothetical protein